MKIKITDYKVYGKEKIYLKGFQNTPNFYQLAFRSAIDSYSNLRCFEKNFQFPPQIMENNEKISENKKKKFFFVQFDVNYT